MSETFKFRTIERIIDANINRAKEGLRVCEEVTRFILESRPLTTQFKKLRHSLDAMFAAFPGRERLLKVRYAESDIGKTIYAGELKRASYKDVFFANIQRVKESLRVLEEFAKLKDAKLALGFKRIRYAAYAVEKKVARRLK